MKAGSSRGSGRQPSERGAHFRTVGRNHNGLDGGALRGTWASKPSRIGDRRSSLAHAECAGPVRLSVVIPVHNERDNLPLLHQRLTRVLLDYGRSYEICYVDDGSTDGSLEWLLDCAKYDRRVRVVELERNVGQHAAIRAGFSVIRGEVAVTLDADLQNPPEEIPRLLNVLDQGFDVVGGWRVNRNDPWPRVLASKTVNALARLLTGTSVRDLGCMLRAYRRHVADAVVALGGASCFVPLLANGVAERVTEVAVAHAPRASGESKYSASRLLGLLRALLLSAVPLAVWRIRWCGVVMFVWGAALAGGLSVLPFASRGEGEGPTLAGAALVGGGLVLVASSFLLPVWWRFHDRGRFMPADAIRAVHGSSLG